MNLKEKLVELFYKSATGSRKVKTKLTPFGIVFFFGGIALLFLLSLWADKIFKLKPFILYPVNLFVSLPLMAFGFFVMIWSVITFFRAKGTPVPFNPPPKLVKEGPYRYVRNPMLSGLFILMFGVGILIKSFSFTFIATPLFIILMIIELKSVEEPELIKRFGEEYISYMKDVPMFVPRIKTSHNNPPS